VDALEGYPNRDSLSYISLYGLEGISTMLRGTLRYEGFCRAWNVFVQLGYTDDETRIDTRNITYADLTESLLPLPFRGNNLPEDLAKFCREKSGSDTMKKIEWTGILSADKIPLQNATAAQILQNLLEKKWKLEEGDKDIIVMQHQFKIQNSAPSPRGRIENLISSLVVKGDNSIDTAMAKTVGLPLGIAAKLILADKVKGRGVMIPIQKEIYEPVLDELKNYKIVFEETNQ